MVGNWKAGLWLATIAGSLLATSSAASSAGKFMSVTGMTSTPIGHVRFCDRHPAECSIRSNRAQVMRLSRARWNELIAINDLVNETIAPVTDQDLYRVVEHWTYPSNRGDCEDYALLKRRMLIRRGWPVGALLMTVVKQSDGSGHAVLTVRTDRGEFILDNQSKAVLRWYDTPYHYIKRQSETDTGAWRRIADRRHMSRDYASK